MTPTTIAALPAHTEATDLALLDGNDSDVAKLATCPHLTRLSLAKSAIGDAGLATLAGLGLKLEALALSTGRGTTSAAIAAVARIATLKDLRAGSVNGLSDAAALATLPALETLDLEGTQIGDETLAALAHAPSLVALNISRTRATPRGVAGLATAATLERLYVRHLQIDAATIAALARLPRLETLELNWLGEDAALDAMRTLKQLVIRWCKKADPAVPDWNRAENLDLLRVHGLPSLRVLDMNQTRVRTLEVEDLPALAELRIEFSWLRKLKVARCTALAALDLKPQGHLNTLELTELPALTALTASGCMKLRKVLVSGAPQLAAPRLPTGVAVAAPKPAKKPSQAKKPATPAA